MPFDEGSVAAAAYGAAAFAVFGEVLFQKMAVGIFYCLQPNSIVIVFFDFWNLD